MENSPTSQNNNNISYRRALIQYSISLNNHQLHPHLVLLLITLQGLQLISAAVIPQLPFKSLALDYFQYAANFLYPDYYLRTTALVMYAIPFTFALTVFHLVTLLYTFKNQSRLKIVVQYFFFLFNTILPIPYLICNISVLYCNTSNPFSHNFTCYQSYHFFYLLLACVNVSWVLFCTLFVCAFYGDKDPLAIHYYAVSANLWTLAKFIVKLSPVIYINVDAGLKFGVLYSVSFAGINLVYFGAFMILWPYHRNCHKLEYFLIRTQLTVVFVCAFLIPLHFFNDDTKNISFILSWLLGIVFSQLLISILDYKKGQLISIYMKDNQEEEVQEYYYIRFFYTFFSSLQNEEANQKKENLTPVLHILKLHQGKCQQQECYCRVLSNIFKCQNNNQNQNGSQYTKQVIYRFICMLMKQAIKQTKKNISLKIALAFISYSKLNQKVRSIHKMSALLSNSKLALDEEVSIRRLFKMLKVNDLEQASTGMRKYLNFAQQLWQFQRKAQKAAVNCRKYWQYLAQQNCQVTKVWRLANIVQRDQINLDLIVNQRVLAIFPNNLHTLRLYCQLLTLLYRSPYQKLQPYIKILDMTSSKLQQTIQKPNEFVFRQNQDTAVMCTVQKDGIFQYLRISNNISKILNIKNIDLIGKNVSSILPEVYQQFHDANMKKYLERTDQNIKGNDRQSSVFTIDHGGRVVGCHYKCKIVPSLRYGIELVCFMKKETAYRPPQSKYLVYFYRKDDQIQQQIQKKAQIVHIDAQLKKILYTPNQNQSKDNSLMASLQQLLPQWDIKNEQIVQTLYTTPDNCRKIENIQLVHRDRLPSGTVNYLKIELRCNKPKITIDPSQPLNFLAKNRKIKTKNVPTLKQSFWSETSESRLNINFFEGQIGEKQGKYAQENGKTEVKTNPIAISPTDLSVLVCFLIILLAIFCILPFKLAPSYSDIQKQWLHIMQQVYQLNKDILQTLTWIQKSFNTNSTSGQPTQQTFDRINTQTKDIYRLIGIDYLDARISIFINVYVEGKQISRGRYTLNNAVSYFNTLLAKAHLQFDSDSKHNLQANIDSFYNSAMEIPNLTAEYQQNRIASIKLREIGFDIAQLCIVFFLLFALCYRIITVSKFCQSAFHLYSEAIEISNLKELIRRCNLAVEKIVGSTTQEIEIEDKKQKSRKLLAQLDFLGPLCKKLIMPSDAEIQEEEERLVRERKKLTFGPIPSKFKYLIIGLCIIMGWFSTKALIKAGKYLKTAQYFQRDKNNVIDNLYGLGTKIQRLIFYLALKQPGAIMGRRVSLQEVQNTLMAIANIQDLRTQINMQNLSKTLSQLKANQSISYLLLQQSLLVSEGEIIQQAKTRKLAQQQQSESRVNRFILGVEIVLSVVTVLAYFRLWTVQEQIRSGSQLMLDMLRDGDQRDICRDKSIVFSPPTSAII